METTITKSIEEFDWHNYNESQSKEKIFFIRLLRELCNLIRDPEHQRGRMPRRMGDVIYSLGLKTYLMLSSRRSCGDIQLSKRAGFVENDLHFNTILKYLNLKELNPILKELIEISALPLKQVETDFAIDATGFSTSKFERWFDIRTCKDSKKRKWRKCHAMCGVSTNIITSVDVSPAFMHDSLKFEGVVSSTARNFQMKEVSADKGYLAKKHYNLVRDFNAVAYIPFKSSTTGKSKGGGDSYTWRTMFRYFRDHQEEFMQHYHKRSNIESCWSMIKARFGMSIKCKKEVAQDNEILLKILCHNLCVLIQEIFLNNIEVDFNNCKEMYTPA